MDNASIPQASPLPWWAIVILALVGPAGIGTIVHRLGGKWLDQRRDEQKAKDEERKTREEERAAERKALLALPGQIETLTKAVTTMGEKIDKALGEVARAESERAESDREQRRQMSTIVTAMALKLGLEDGHSSPASTSTPGRSNVRRVGSIPGT